MKLLKLNKTARKTSGNSNFQVRPQILNCFQIWTLILPLQLKHKLWSKSLQWIEIHVQSAIFHMHAMSSSEFVAKCKPDFLQLSSNITFSASLPLRSDLCLAHPMLSCQQQPTTGTADLNSSSRVTVVHMAALIALQVSHVLVFCSWVKLFWLSVNRLNSETIQALGYCD